jgi:hypothetical protein
MIAWDLLEKTLGGKCSSNSRIISRRHSLKCRRSSPCCELVGSDLCPRYETLTVETVSTHAMLYTWHGSMEGLKPLFFMGHSDVSTQDIPLSRPSDNPRLFPLASRLPPNGLTLPFRATTMGNSSGDEGRRTTNPTLLRCSLLLIVYFLATSTHFEQ